MADGKNGADLPAEADDAKGAEDAEKNTGAMESGAPDEGDTDLDAEAAHQKSIEDALKRERDIGRKEGAAAIAFKLRQKKRAKGSDETDESEGEATDDDTETDEDDDKPLTKKELAKILEADRIRTRKEMQGEMIAEKAKKLTTNPTEAELIIEIHKNRIFPDGMTLDEQLEEAHIIANGKRILKKSQEITRALKGKETASKDASGTHRDAQPSGQPKLPQADLRAMQAVGYAYDGKTGLFVKKIGKRTLTYDPKTKTRKVIAT